MKNDILNRKTTIGLVILMIVYLIIRFAGPVVAPLYTNYTDPYVYQDTLETRVWFELIHLIFTRGFAIAVGIFLIFEAKRANYNRALWFCLGALFSLIAVILFYVFRIYENTRPQDTGAPETNEK